MKRLIAFGTGAFTIAASNIAAPPTHAGDCYVVRATAGARNPCVSAVRAQNKLQHQITRRVTSTTGQHAASVHMQCIRNACEASAITCQIHH